MRKFVLLTATAILATINVLAAAKAEEKHGEPRRILLIGDSQAANLAAELRFKSMDNGLSFESLSGVGTRAIGWVGSGKMKRRLRDFNPDVVVLSFGTNEAKYDRSIDLLVRQFDSLLKVVSPDGRRKVFWIAPPRLPGVDYLANVREALRKTEEKKTIVTIDLSDRVYAVNGSGIHLTHAAYIVWAWDIWQQLYPKL